MFPSSWWSRVQSPEPVDLFLLIPAPAKTSSVVSAISQKQYLLLCLYVIRHKKTPNQTSLGSLSSFYGRGNPVKEFIL
jgi:hypothetical protein